MRPNRRSPPDEHGRCNCAGEIVTTALIGAGHAAITFIVALDRGGPLLVSAFTTRGYGRCRPRRRRRLHWRW